MPEDREGSMTEGDVLNSPEVQAAIKEAREKAYREGQSAADKGAKAALEKASQEAKSAAEALAKYEADRFANLTPEEQQAEIIRKLWEDRKSPASQGATPTSPKVEDPPQEPEEPQNSPEERIAQVLKAQGIDPKEVDMTSTEAFVKSLLNRKAVVSEEEDTEEKPDPVLSSSNAKVGDVGQTNTEDLFRKSFRNKHRR